MADGYRRIMIDRRPYRENRIAWAWMTGECPSYVDHINGDKADNRWCNLRLATPSQNTWNSRKQKRNSTGFKGVSKSYGTRFRATISAHGKLHFIGCFATAEEAYAAYCARAAELHGEFARVK